jgi:ankyrin repeat protein
MAALAGHTECVDEMIRSGMILGLRNELRARTPLHLASSRGHTDVVKLIVEKGARIDNRDNADLTALHLACMNGHLGVVEVLLQNGGNLVGVTESETSSKFSFAEEDLQEEDEDKVEEDEDKVDHDASDRELQLLTGCEGEESAVVRVAGNVAEKLFTPVALACYRGHVDIVQRMLCRDVAATSRTFGGEGENVDQFFDYLRECAATPDNRAIMLTVIETSRMEWRRRHELSRKLTATERGEQESFRKLTATERDEVVENPLGPGSVGERERVENQLGPDSRAHSASERVHL